MHAVVLTPPSLVMFVFVCPCVIVSYIWVGLFPDDPSADLSILSEVTKHTVGHLSAVVLRWARTDGKPLIWLTDFMFWLLTYRLCSSHVTTFQAILSQPIKRSQALTSLLRCGTRLQQKQRAVHAIISSVAGSQQSRIPA